MRKTLLLTGTLLLSLSLFAQVKMKNPEEPAPEDTTTKPRKERSEFWKNVRLGGNFGGLFGNYTYIQLNPVAGYLVQPEWMVGLSANYIYQSERQGGKTLYTANVYGGSAFTRYNVTNGLFATAEYEALNSVFFDPVSRYSSRRWVGSPLIGAGYTSGGSDFRGGYIMVLYNLNQTLYSPYPNALIIRFGVLF